MRKPDRTRNVRYCYPDALVEICLLLSKFLPMHTVGTKMGVPKSTLYRWVEVGTDAPMPAAEQIETWLAHRVCICEQKGFPVRRSLELLADSAPMAYRAAFEHACACSDNVAVGGRATRPDVVLGALPSHDVAMSRVREAIRTTYFTDVSLDSLASIAGLSKWHLLKRFKQTFGTTPHKLLRSVRLAAAKALLPRPSYSLETIAAAVGFENASTLCKAFKACEGAPLSSRFRDLRANASPAFQSTL